MQIRQIHQHDFAQVDQLIRTAFENSEHGYGNESEGNWFSVSTCIC